MQGSGLHLPSMLPQAYYLVQQSDLPELCVSRTRASTIETHIQARDTLSARPSYDILDLPEHEVSHPLHCSPIRLLRRCNLNFSQRITWQ